MSLLCPEDGTKLHCNNSRMSNAGKNTRRTYDCPKCGARYSTLEQFVEKGLTTVEHNQRAKPCYIELQAMLEKIQDAISTFEKSNESK